MYIFLPKLIGDNLVISYVLLCVGIWMVFAKFHALCFQQMRSSIIPLMLGLKNETWELLALDLSRLITLWLGRC